MKLVLLLAFVATLVLVSEATELSARDTLEKVADHIDRAVKRSAEKREWGIHWKLGRCSQMNEECSAIQHCCGELDCGGRKIGFFGNVCKNKND